MVLPARMNPWIEMTPEHRVNEVRRDLELSRRAVRAAAEADPKLRRAADAYDDAIARIIVQLSATPDAWRRLRAFIVVDVPAIVQAAAGMAELADGPARSGLRASLVEALSVAPEKADLLEADRARDLTTGLDVLSAPTPPAPESAPGFLSGLGRRARALGDEAGRIASYSAEETARLTSRASGAATGLAILSGSYVTNILGDAGRLVTRPVTSRIAALGGAVSETSFAAMVLGGLTSLVFPPLAPFVMGEAMLGVPEAYAARIAELSEEDARADLARRGEREERINEIMAAIRGGPIRFDTPCLSITMDPSTGRASGIVLKGRHTGEVLEALDAATVAHMRDTAPEDETRRALDAWIRRTA